jgi:chorismate mutase
MRLRAFLAAGLAGAAALTVSLVAVPAASATSSNHHDASFATLVDVSAQRALIANDVAAFKFNTGGSIEDPAREQQLLDQVAALSAEQGDDPAVAQAIFRDEIDGNKTVQYGLFDLWTAHPELTPTEWPDLTTVIRPELDKITTELMAEITATKDLQVSPDCHHKLGEATAKVDHDRHLDPLHVRALNQALARVCHN